MSPTGAPARFSTTVFEVKLIPVGAWLASVTDTVIAFEKVLPPASVDSIVTLKEGFVS